MRYLSASLKIVIHCFSLSSCTWVWSCPFDLLALLAELP